MAAEQNMVISDTFEAVLDETCERLWDTHVRYSLRRIGELEAALCAMEQELDEIIHAAPNGRPSGT